MEKKDKEMRNLTTARKLLEDLPESEYKSLLSLLDTLENLTRGRRRPTYTSYYVNMAVSTE